MTTMIRTTLWLRLDLPGHDCCAFDDRPSGFGLSGTAVFAFNRRPCRLDYAVGCDPKGRTRRASVRGWVGTSPVEVSIAVDARGRWRLNGRPCPAVSGCEDLDLRFSPSTNALPLRRLALSVGDEAPVRSAWLTFPSFRLVLLRQRYKRISASSYAYHSGAFTAGLTVDSAGIVQTYGHQWQTEAQTLK
jgi:uncharacterized protein